MNLAQLHRTRLENDYKEMRRIANSPMVSWVAEKGKAPYVEQYLLTIKVRTYSGPGKIMEQCKVRISLPTDYPKVAPNTEMIGTVVYHPNWWENGRWCCGTYKMTESLGNYVVRLIQTLQFDPVVTNPSSPANRDAKDWYLKNKELFPSDHQPLPNPNAQIGFKRIN